MPVRRSIRWLAAASAGLALLALAASLFHVPVLRAVGGWLVVSDQLVPADAIVVLAGGTPASELEAAELYRRGLAPRVILSRASMSSNHMGLMRLGIRRHSFQTEARLVLEKRGVPADAIVDLTQWVRITETELRLVRQTAAALGYRRLILITSPDHTRRVKMIWSRLPPHGVEGLAHATPGAVFSPEDWWRYRRTFELVLHEYLGIGALALGISHWLQ